jgi:hypothetical protein
MAGQKPAPPEPMKRRRTALIVAAVIASTAIMATGAGPAAGSASEPIPLAPLTDLTALDATVTINVDGTVNGEPTQGDLTAQLTSTAEGTSRIDVTGSLLGEVVAQVGGSAVKLFRPKKVSVYAVPEGTYVVLDALLDVCVKPADSQATEALDQLSPQALMDILTGSDVARGTFVGDEVLNDRALKHYSIDGDEFLAAAQGSSDPNVSLFAQSLVSAADADLYVSAEGGYPVAYSGSFGGVFEPLAFEGDLTVQIALTGVNGDNEVTLPGTCDHPIST